jgi:hypothetical protein
MNGLLQKILLLIVNIITFMIFVRKEKEKIKEPNINAKMLLFDSLICLIIKN